MLKIHRITRRISRRASGDALSSHGAAGNDRHTVRLYFRTVDNLACQENTYPFVNEQGRRSLNFQLSMTIMPLRRHSSFC
jgi:hypothetical protein